MKVAPIAEKLQSHRLRWYGHIQRREETHICKEVQNFNVSGKGHRGRPSKTWDECIKMDMKTRGLISGDALDREKWKKLTLAADPK